MELIWIRAHPNINPSTLFAALSMNLNSNSFVFTNLLDTISLKEIEESVKVSRKRSTLLCNDEPYTIDDNFQMMSYFNNSMDVWKDHHKNLTSK